MTILQSGPESIENLVQTLVKQARSYLDGYNAVLESAPIKAVHSRISIGRHAVSPLSESVGPHPFKALILIHGVDTPQTDGMEGRSTSDSNVLRLYLPLGKKGQFAFMERVLPSAIEFARQHVCSGADTSDIAIDNVPGYVKPSAFGILCEDGKDASVGVAMAVMQALFDEHGNLMALDPKFMHGKHRRVRTASARLTPHDACS